MAEMHEIIDMLCERNSINGNKLSADLGMSKSFLTELRKGRAKSVKIETAAKIADYFGVSIEFLMTGEESTENEKRPVYDDEAWAMMEEMHKRPELKALFKTTKNVKPEDIKAVDDLLKRMARESGYDT